LNKLITTEKVKTSHPTSAHEWQLYLTFGTFLVAFFGSRWIVRATELPAILILWLAILCVVILIAAIAMVHHAEVLALRLGEPGGTLLLTMAVTGLEVAMIGFVMSTGYEKPTLARDTMYAAVMLVINGFMGLALLLGGLRYREQTYNLQSANAFLIMIVPLTILGLVLPNFTRSTEGPILSTFQMIFLSIMSVGIYGVFLFVQNGRHRGFFVSEDESIESEEVDAAIEDASEHQSPRSTFYHAAMLVGYGLPLVLLAKQMSKPLDGLVEKLGAPVALGGFIMAVLVLMPESIAAIRAARDNRLQRSVNILLGSALASIGLTIPLVIAISLVTGRSLILGLENADMVMLVLTLFTATLTFTLPRTNMLLGCVHLLLFAAFCMLLFDY
jgi:Ca2+:H+ antiporter